MTWYDLCFIVAGGFELIDNLVEFRGGDGFEVTRDFTTKRVLELEPAVR